MSLTKADLADILIDNFHFNKKIAKEYVDAFFAEITHGVIHEGFVKLSGFGKFITLDKNSRPGRNPKTGDYAKISARRVVTFHTAQKLKAIIEGTLDPSSLDELDD